MAETFLAIRRGPGGFEQHVCVKRILPFYERDPAFVADFLEEARLAAQLRHSNIAQVIDFGAVDGSHYLALELIDGMDLRSLLRRLGEHGRRLDPTLVVLVGLELAAALEFAHTPSRGRQAVVHRDISPSNILLSRSGAVYLTDFGIARAVGTKRRTESGVLRGKIPYVAPEYAQRAHYDQRTDLFSLGVVLFEALAGQRPFVGQTDLDTLQRITEGRRPSLQPLVPEAPGTLVQAIETLLEADPDRRYPSARYLIDALTPISPPATTGRQLAELVGAMADPLTGPLGISAAGRTAVLPAVAAPPAYPSVSVGPAGAATQTSEVDRASFPATGPSRRALPEPGWASTSPDRVSHHDRPSPLSTPSPSPPDRLPPTLDGLASGPAAGQAARPPHRAAPVAPLAAGAPFPASAPHAYAQRPSQPGSHPPPSQPVSPPLRKTTPMQHAAAMDLQLADRMPSAHPAIDPTRSAAPARRRWVLILIVVLGVLAFVVATAAAYAAVVALRPG